MPYIGIELEETKLEAASSGRVWERKRGGLAFREGDGELDEEAIGCSVEEEAPSLGWV